jgi:hypothetical protein
MKGLLTVLLLFFVTSLLGQGFTYSYVDPCSKKLKTLYVNNNQNVTINYLGQTNSFSQQDFTSGAFDNWISTVQSQASSSPCDEVMTYQQRFQNMVVTQNLISTLTSVTATSTMNMSSALGNSVSNSSSNSEPKRKDKQQSKNNGTTNSNNPSSVNLQNGSTTQGGTTNSGGGQNNPQPTTGGSNSSGETNSQNSGNPSNTTNPSQGGSGQTEPSVNNPSSNPSSNPPSNPSSSGNSSGNSGGNTGSNTGSNTGNSDGNSGGGAGGTSNSISNASSNSKVKVGTIIGTGDIVAIRSNEDGSNQLKGTMSVTKANTNNTLAKGALLTFTTAINNSSVTLYGAFTNKKKTNVLIVANSSMLDFDRNVFNTTTALESKKFGNVSVMGGANFTIGGLYGEPFSNLSAVGGGFVPFKVNKKINGNILLLGVYSPFTKFYEGKWWNSGLLVVPFSSWDYTISKSFKYNISFSGTYEVKGSVLQYQILTGGKILL